MGEAATLLLSAGGTLLVLGPPAFILIAMEGRVRGHRKGPRLFAAAAMWSALAAYAALATGAVINGLQAPPGPWWERIVVGVARLPLFAQAILVVSGVTVLGSWWILREEEQASPEASGEASPSPPPPQEE